MSDEVGVVAPPAYIFCGHVEFDLMLLRPRPVYVLIDWNSELKALRKSAEGDETEVARHALKQVCRDVGRLLHNEIGEASLFLYLRVYHGWRRGFEPTLRRRGLEQARRFFSPNDPEDRGLAAYSRRPSQAIRSLEFGDRMLGAREERLCGQGDHHLPFTLQDGPTGALTEKMVDTALIADLIHLASDDNGSWVVVVGQDADLVPGILAADGLLHGSDRRVIYFARGGIKQINRKMDDLICRR